MMDVEGPGSARPALPTSLSGPMPEQPTSNYTIPGILHFIKHEWSRFEKDKASWEVERAELNAKIAFLQGERRGHENLMHDLVRRIKMLEFALKQERAKLYELQHGKKLVFADMKPPVSEQENNPSQLDMSALSSQKEESRKILREYLREVGFPDNVLEARMARISAYKSLYNQNQLMEGGPSLRSVSPKPSPLSLPPSVPPPLLPNGPIANGTDMQITPSSSQARDPSLTHPLDSLPVDEDIGNAEVATSEEESVLNTFNFLVEEEDDNSDDEDDDDESGGWIKQDLSPTTGLLDLESKANSDALSDSSGVEADMLLTEDTLDEFEKGNVESQEGWRDEFSQQVIKYTQHKPKKTKKASTRPSRAELQHMKQYAYEAENQTPLASSQQSAASSQPPSSFGMGIIRLPGRMPGSDNEALGVAEDAIQASLLGDLAVLSIANETPENPLTETVKKWENRFTMRSHFDAVTCLDFHPSDDVLITGSDDCTLKVWNIQRANQARRSTIVDVEPIHTFRGHRGNVLSVAIGLGGEICFSGSADSNIRVWQLPGDFSDPFDVYDPQLHQGVLQGHTDAIWDLVVHPNSGLLLSCSSDGTCRLWNHQHTSPQLKSYQSETRFGNPTSVAFVATDLHHMVASYSAAKAVVFDLETSQPVLNLDSASTYDGTPNTQINKIVCHPTLPIIVTGHEDKYIRMYDSNSGKVIHSMTGHLDAVSGLAIDPHGLYLLSGGHDGSLRFWSVDSKMCIQEITAHRKRYDESVYNVACHLTKPYFASAGADGIAKVFV